MDWTQFGINSASIAVLAGLVAFLGRAVIRTLLAADLQAHKASLDRDLEAFRSELRLEAERELQRQKADDERRRAEHDAGFRWLLGVRNEAIQELYSEMRNAVEATYDAVLADESDVEGHQAKHLRAINAKNSFASTVDRNRLLISGGVSRRLGGVDREIGRVLHLSRRMGRAMELGDAAKAGEWAVEGFDRMPELMTAQEAAFEAMKLEITSPLGTVSDTEAPETS